MAELYDHILCLEAYAVRLALAVSGFTCERRSVTWNPADGIPAPDVVAFNPAGTLPVFVDQSKTFTTVPAILEVIAAGSRWWPPGSREVGHWVAFAAGPLFAVSRARSVRLFGAAGDLPDLQSASRNALRLVEDRLTDRTLGDEAWLADATPTFADIAVFAPVMLSHDAGIGHEDYPAINLWQRRVRRLRGFIGMPGIPDYF